MKHFFLCTVVLVFVHPSYYAIGQEGSLEPVVVLDPGHGGIDSGAIGINGIREKDITLDIVREVLRLNRNLYNDTLQIFSTRYTDTLISLRDRTKLTKALNSVVFVSIHCNQAQRKAAQGIEVYVGRTTRDEDAYTLAAVFAKGLNRNLGFKNRGVKYADFQVLRETTHCPSLLLELGFLSNREEAEHNQRKESITALALLILESLMKYVNHD